MIITWTPRRVMNSLALFAIAFTIPAFAQTNIITTAAGGFTGDGGAATSAMVNYPRAVAVGADGSLYIADTNSHRVRRVGTDGKISTYAGNGTSGFSGDGGPAASAQLYSPAAVAIGSDGILYIADYNNNRIRRVTPDGQISTLTGTGPASFGGDGGPASSAQVSHPFGVAVGKDNSVFIADYENHRIRRVTTDGKISTFAGNGTGGSAGDGGLAPAAQLNYPRAMTMAADGTLYIADTYNHLIRRVGTDGKISTVVGTGVSGFSGDSGAATSAQISNPGAVAVGTDNSLYIADSDNHRIRRVGTDGKISTFAGTGVGGYAGDAGAATSALLFYPNGLAFAGDGSLYVADYNNLRVRRIASDTRIFTAAGTGVTGANGDGSPAAGAQLSHPFGITVTNDGTLYIADSYNNRVRRVSTDGKITTFAGTGVLGFGGDLGPATGAQLNSPYSTAVAPDGTVYIADSDNHRIRKVGADGKISSFAGTGLGNFGGDGGPASSAQISFPRGITVAKDGTVYVADTFNHRIRRIGTDGKISTIAGTSTNGFSGDGGPATSAQLYYPYGVAVAADGTTLYIADSYNQRIRKIGADGKISTIAGTGTAALGGDGGPAANAQFSYPYRVAVATDGTLYVADLYNQRIRKIGTDNKISTLAGSTLFGFGGDGGPATAANLLYPYDVAAGADGAVYIADSLNHRIRKVSPATAIPAPTLSALVPASTAAGSANLLLTISGTNFTSAAIVSWNGSPLNTTFVSATQLTAIVPSALLTTPGSANVTVASAGSTSNSLPFTISSSVTNPVSVTVDTLPSGLGVVVDGTAAATPANFTWLPGSMHALSVPSPQGTGTTRYIFDHWSQGGVNAQTITTPALSATYTAIMGVQYLLTTAVSPAAGGTLAASPASSDGYYSDSALVRLTATAASNYTFANLSGDLNGPISPQVLTMTGPKTVVANFTQNQVTNIKVTISSSPAGRTILVDGSPITAPADFNWPSGSTHVLDVQSPQGVGFTRYAFDSWSNGASRSQVITIPASATTYTASFLNQHLVTIAVSPSDGGTVLANPASNDGFYNQGTPLQLTATANPNFAFSGFNGDLPGSANPQTLAVNAPKNVTATFTPVTPLTVTPAHLPSLTATQGSNASTTFQITGGSPGQTVSVNVDQPWLRVNPSQGVPPFTVSVVAASNALAVSSYSGNVTVGGTIILPVTFQVTEANTRPQLISDALAAGLQFFVYVGYPVPPKQTINIKSSDGSPLTYATSIKYLQGNGWVTLSSRGGTTPGTLDVGVQINSLTPGTYTAALMLSADLAIPITLAYVNPPSQSQIEVDLQEVKLSSVGAPQNTSVLVKNSGAGTLPFTVSVQTDAGSPSDWLTVSPPNGGTAIDQAPAVLKITADPSKLPPGTYTGTLLITDTNQNTVKLPVIFAVSATKSLKAALTGLTLQIGATYNDFPPQPVELLAYGNSPVSWSAQADSSWMRLNPPSGTVLPNTVGGPQLGFDLSKLQSGLNTGLITIKSDSSGGDLTLRVSVTKAPPGVAINRLQPLALVSVPPFSQQTVAYVPSTSTPKLNLSSNQSWLTFEDVTPGSLQSNTHTLRITVHNQGLPIGQPQYGAITIQEPQNGQGAVLNVLAYAPVPGGGGNRSSRTSGRSVSASGCVPSQFFSYPTSFSPSFEQNGGSATSTEVFILDDCGGPVTSAVTGGVLGNRDPQLNLRSLGDGRWKATWNPTTPNSFVTLNILGADPDNSLYSAPLQAYSSVTGSSNAPALAKDQPFETEPGVRLPALAPSMQFRIRGQNFLNSDGSAPAVAIGGKALTVLSATGSQLVVSTPPDLNVNVEAQLVIQRTDGSSVPEPVIVAATWPSLAAYGDASKHEFFITGLGKAAPESLNVDGATIRSIEPAGEGLWRVLADRDLRGLKLRAGPSE